MKQATALLRMFPDFDRSTKEAVMAVAAKLESLSPEMRKRVLSPVDGIVSKQPYAPTPFHIDQFVAKASEFSQPSATSWQRLGPETPPPGYDFDTGSRKAFIASLSLEKQFPEGGHRREKPERVEWDDSLGPPTERKLNPHRIPARSLD